MAKVFYEVSRLLAWQYEKVGRATNEGIRDLRVGGLKQVDR